MARELIVEEPPPEELENPAPPTALDLAAEGFWRLQPQTHVLAITHAFRFLLSLGPPSDGDHTVRCFCCEGRGFIRHTYAKSPGGYRGGETSPEGAWQADCPVCVQLGDVSGYHLGRLRRGRLYVGAVRAFLESFDAGGYD
jgi:hypothetical protein